MIIPSPRPPPHAPRPHRDQMPLLFYPAPRGGDEREAGRGRNLLSAVPFPSPPPHASRPQPAAATSYRQCPPPLPLPMPRSRACAPFPSGSQMCWRQFRSPYPGHVPVVLSWTRPGRVVLDTSRTCPGRVQDATLPALFLPPPSQDAPWQRPGGSAGGFSLPPSFCRLGCMPFFIPPAEINPHAGGWRIPRPVFFSPPPPPPPHCMYTDPLRPPPEPRHLLFFASSMPFSVSCLTVVSYSRPLRPPQRPPPPPVLSLPPGLWMAHPPFEDSAFLSC
jgi:hypothetical protein